MKVLIDKDGTSLGRLDIIHNKEPIDIINRFIQACRISTVYEDKGSLYRCYVLQKVCEEVICTQSALVVHNNMINDINGNSLGTVEVFEFEEVVDDIVCFITDTNKELDHNTLKN